jgi:hypothetical protein
MSSVNLVANKDLPPITVDEEDLDKTFTLREILDRGSISIIIRKNGSVEGTKISLSLHSLLTGYPLTDHIDRNPLNNSKSNLREATPLQNILNIGVTKRNKTGYKGVSKRRGRYRAAISSGKEKSFDTAEEAAKWYDSEMLALYPEHKEFIYLNFPEEHA